MRSLCAVDIAFSVAMITLPYHFRGPLTSANGGYACGRLAAFVDADEVEVTLRLPPPLDRPLTVEREGDGAKLLDGDALVAEARPSASRSRPRHPVSVDDRARCARERHVRGAGHRSSVSASSAVCAVTVSRFGSDSSRDASRCTPRRSYWTIRRPRSSGRRSTARARLRWAREGRGDIVLGRMTARVHRVPEAGEQCVVTAWPLGEDGRKLFAGTALFAGGRRAPRPRQPDLDRPAAVGARLASPSGDRRVAPTTAASARAAGRRRRRTPGRSPRRRASRCPRSFGSRAPGPSS